MQFIRSSWEQAEAAVIKRLLKELGDGKNVLWLVSGGSQVQSNVKIMSAVPDYLTPKLSVMPVDERYGPPGHPESNWAKLMTAGFDAKQSRLISALKKGLDFHQNIDYYEQLVTNSFEKNEVIIGQLGIGTDGHIAGILPHSPACSQTAKLVTGYDAPPLQRMTTTFQAIRQFNPVYVLAFGQEKLKPLQQLKEQTIPLNEEPAQILKELPEVYVYNDLMEEQ